MTEIALQSDVRILSNTIRCDEMGSTMGNPRRISRRFQRSTATAPPMVTNVKRPTYFVLMTKDRATPVAMSHLHHGFEKGLWRCL